MGCGQLWGRGLAEGLRYFCYAENSAVNRERRFKYMKRMIICAGIILVVTMMAGCKKRYIPRIHEEVIDPGVPVYEEFVVE